MGYSPCNDGEDWEAFELAELSWVSTLFQMKNAVETDNSAITVWFTNGQMFDHYLYNHDLMLLGLSFVLVFGVLWVNTSSFFLSTCGIFEIIISFPAGLFVWLVVGQQDGVTYLMYNGVFIIIGIGCDDIFVFIDAFRQAELEPPHISGSLETRFAWAYNRAAGAMLATSLTTTLAFLGCATSQIWDIRCFGVVNGTMVLFDYLLVITWFPAAVVIYKRHFNTCLQMCTPQHCITFPTRKCQQMMGKKEATIGLAKEDN